MRPGPCPRQTARVLLATLTVVLLAAVGFVGTAALLSHPAAAAGSGQSCTTSRCTLTFASVGNSTWTVPEGVTSASFTVDGAAGGSYASPGSAPGKGGEVAATVGGLSGGQSVVLEVGGQGGSGDHGAGGVNGGGSGGTFAAGGGGYSAVVVGGADVIVAGGGGGGGSGDAGSSYPGSVGGTGGQVGGAGGPSGPVIGGDGGTAGSGGAGGVAPCSTENGGAGSSLTGGTGSSGGGGGGGGWFGGGQGAGSFACWSTGASGGGGGGSSHVGSNTSGVSYQSGARSGDGRIVVSYTDPVTAGATSYKTTKGKAVHKAAPGVLSAASGPGTLAVALSSGPSHGNLTLNGNGSFSYTPASGYVGSDAFTYRVSDVDGDYASATATITIAKKNKKKSGGGGGGSAPPAHHTKGGGSGQSQGGGGGGVAPVVVPTPPASPTMSSSPTPTPTSTPTPTPTPTASPTSALSPTSGASSSGAAASPAGGVVTAPYDPDYNVDRDKADAPSVLTVKAPSIFTVAAHPQLIAAALGAGLVWTLLLVVAMGALDDAVKTRYENWTKRMSRLRLPVWVRRFFTFLAGSHWLPLIGLLGVHVVVMSLVDPHFSVDATSGRLMLSVIAADLAIVVLPAVLTARVSRRRWRVEASVRAVPWGVLIGILGVAISRLIGFVPGLLSGSTMEMKQPHASVVDKVRTLRFRTVLALVLGAVCWIVSQLVSTTGNVVTLWAHDAAIAGMIVAFVGAPVDLLPLSFMAGGTLFRHARRTWAALLICAVTAFVALVVPQPSYWLKLGHRVTWWLIVASLAIVTTLVVVVVLHRREQAKAAAEELGPAQA